jgi:periplasmic protein TonB
MRRRRGLRVVIAYKAMRSRLSRFVTGSFAVHGLLLAAVIVIPAARHHARPIEDTMVVELAGPMAAAPAPAQSAPASTAPAPAPRAAPPVPKAVHAVREVPIAKPKDKPVKPKPQPEPEVPAKPQPEPASTEPAVGDAAKAGAPKSTAVSGAVTATVGGGDTSMNWYGAAVKAALESAWAKPYLEDAQGVASVVIAFDIARDGTTRNLRIVQSSGIPSMDRSAQRAVIEASPLPGLPPSYSDDTIPVTMRFDLAPEPR